MANLQPTTLAIREKQKSPFRVEDQVLYLCTRQDIKSLHLEKLSDIFRREEIRWKKIFSTAHQHGVAPLVYTSLGKLNKQRPNIPNEIDEKFRLAKVRSIAIAGKRFAQLEKIYAFFEKLSIEVMVIKGAAHEITVYDQPWYTTSNDLDLIIKLDPEEFNETDKWELEYLKRDIPLEYDFMVHHDVTMNGILPVDFHTIWEDACGIRFEGQSLFVMSPEDMLITACINSCRKRYFRLKALFDIAEITYNYPDLNWTELTRKAKVYQCNNIVYTALWTTNETLGCDAPTVVFSDLDVNPRRALIIQRLIKRLSTYPLSDLISKNRVFGRRAGLSIMLPYASYRWEQVVRKIGFVWSTRYFNVNSG